MQFKNRKSLLGFVFKWAFCQQFLVAPSIDLALTHQKYSSKASKCTDMTQDYLNTKTASFEPLFLSDDLIAIAVP